MQRRVLIGITALPALIAAGCSGATPPSLPSIAEISGAASQAPVVGSPTEAYERIARGALACWFGTAGPLKADYIYHAQAEPASKGGRAEIAIHERDRLSANPKGLRAWRLVIAREKETTTLTSENLKLPEAQATAMESDARRWAAGSIGCEEAKSSGWTESMPPDPVKDGATGSKRRP